MVSPEWVGWRGEFRDIRNNFAILERLNGGTTCSRGVERAGFKGIETRYGFDSFLVEFMFRVECMPGGYAEGTPNTKLGDAGLKIWINFTWNRNKMDILSNNNRNFDE